MTLSYTLNSSSSNIKLLLPMNCDCTITAVLFTLHTLWLNTSANKNEALPIFLLKIHQNNIVIIYLYKSINFVSKSEIIYFSNKQFFVPSENINFSELWHNKEIFSKVDRNRLFWQILIKIFTDDAFYFK